MFFVEIVIINFITNNLHTHMYRPVYAIFSVELEPSKHLEG